MKERAGQRIAVIPEENGHFEDFGSLLLDKIKNDGFFQTASFSAVMFLILSMFR
jgi:hypothetical protein